MVFAYMIGVLLFIILYFGGSWVFINFLDPYPPNIPNDIEYDDSYVCNILVDRKPHKCLKTVHIWKTYGYGADCDVIEWEHRFFKYELKNPITEFPNFIDNACRTLILNDSENEIECYMSDLKTFIPTNAIKNERIYLYRKPKILRIFSRKRKSASL